MLICHCILVLCIIMYIYVQHIAIIMINNDICNDIAHEWYFNCNDSHGYHS